MKELDKFRLKNVKSIQVIPPSDPKSAALLGSQGALGVVCINTKEKKQHLESLFQ